MRVVRESASSNNSSQNIATSVEQSLPEPDGPDGGESSSSSNDRREEITNYELSTKTVSTVSDGFGLESLSVAVLVNREQLAGGADAPEDAINQQLSEIEEFVATAADLRVERGDQIKVLAVDFAGASEQLEPIPPVGMTELLVRQLGTVVNAATILVVALLLIWFGLRPATRAILAKPAQAPEALALTSDERDPAMALEDDYPGDAALAQEGSLIDDLTVQLKRSPAKKLEQMVRFNDEQSAAILKRWIHEGAQT